MYYVVPLLSSIEYRTKLQKPIQQEKAKFFTIFNLFEYSSDLSRLLTFGKLFLANYI